MGSLFVADGVRVLARSALQKIGAQVNDALGLATAPATHDFVHHPAVAVLHELLEELRAAGVHTVIFVAPVNTDRIARLHLTGEIGLDEHLVELRRAIGASRDEWLDAHASFRDRDFRDALHVKAPAVAELGAQIARRLRDRLDVEEARSADSRSAR